MAHLGNTVVNGNLRANNRVTPGQAVNQIFTGTGVIGGDKGSGVSPRYFPSTWTFNLGFTPQNGDKITILVPVAGITYGVYLSIDNGVTYYPVGYKGTTRVTTHYPANSELTLIFNSTASTTSIYPLNGGDASTTVTGGAWHVPNFYADGNDNTYDRNRFNVAIKAWGTALTKYNIIVADKNGLYRHLKEGSVFSLNYPILYLNADVAANATTTNSYDCIPFTVTTTQSITLTAYKPVYIKGTMSTSDNTFIPIGAAPLTQTEPTTDDGFWYLELGYAYSATTIYLTNIHRIIKFRDNRIGEYVVHATACTRLSGRTVTDSVTQNDINLVSSGAVYTAINNAIDQVLNASY